MPRPAKPLIQYDAVIETSLRIIDEEGLEAFSLPRLSRELNVRAPSLYHHFADKAEIMRGIARAIVLQARLPRLEQAPTWIEWFVQVSLSFRASVLNHRNAAPILLQFMPREVLVRTYDASAQMLAELGVPADQQVLILDGVDRLTLAAAITEAVRDPDGSNQPFANAGPETEPTLSAAVKANQLSSEELFAETIRSFLRGAAPYVPADAPAPMPPAAFLS
ncbi:TetR/AcrR family transcriptional regulator [Kineosporia babensis]|uniref:TetR family transcriptional regulator n=1 Tax=Kineosporia babensis TaxID=499548 RepID=A0A9X1SVS9_9ACTN|nr:TetR family transcriptional regulator [Kineosporia babensis]MCD5314006.1 TetR family transcriptional regulator [Kineosporia babensis]